MFLPVYVHLEWEDILGIGQTPDEAREDAQDRMTKDASMFTRLLSKRMEGQAFEAPPLTGRPAQILLQGEDSTECLKTYKALARLVHGDFNASASDGKGDTSREQAPTPDGESGSGLEPQQPAAPKGPEDDEG